MPIHELAALAAAFCWALTGVMSAGPVAKVGPFAFNLFRQGFVTAVLAVLVLATGAWHGTDTALIPRMVVSGIIGILMGDTMLFFALRRLGPRRTGALFALNAPMAALLGWVFLGETLSPQGAAGVALCTAGVALSVLGRSGSNRFETLQGAIWPGIALGLLAALG